MGGEAPDCRTYGAPVVRPGAPRGPYVGQLPQDIALGAGALDPRVESSPSETPSGRNWMGRKERILQQVIDGAMPSLAPGEDIRVATVAEIGSMKPVAKGTA